MNHNSSKGLDPKSSSSQPFLWPIIKNLLLRHQKVNVLDIGCGAGEYSHKLSGLGHKVVGTDISESAIEVARKKAPMVHFICSDIYNLPWNEIDEKFDVTISIEVIEHLYYPRSLIQAALRSLKPGGTFVLSTPYHGYLKNLFLSLLNKWDNHFNVLEDGWHIKFFSTYTLRKLLYEEGFIDIEFCFGGRLPFLWKSMICRASKAIN